MPVTKKTSSKKRVTLLAASGKPAARRMRLQADVLDNSIGYSLRRAQLSTYDEFSAVMEPFEIRPSQFAVLVLIHANPGLTQSAICSTLGIQKTNFVALLDKLEARGFTERRKLGTDRRSSALHLTRGGESFVARMEAAHNALEKRLIRRLGSRLTRELLEILHQFTAKAHSARTERIATSQRNTLVARNLIDSLC